MQPQGIPPNKLAFAVRTALYGERAARWLGISFLIPNGMRQYN